MSLSENDAFMVLNSLPHVGPITLQRLMESFNDDPVAILEASLRRLESVRDVGPVIAHSITGWRSSVNLELLHEKLNKSGIQFLSRTHTAYPSLLKEIYDAPIGLYWKGNLLPEMPCIGFVGTRRATLYGTGIAKKLAGELAKRGYCIVSGLARGIDSAAHRGALEAGGKTLAVLGCGVDIVYPPENYELYSEIVKTGAVISEFPLGRRADKQTFPMRNRIIAGMCKGVVIVESGAQGGSMISARFAVEQGRTVFAVPGRIDQESSRGCHALIREGAILTTCVEDILEELDTHFQRELIFDQQKDLIDQAKMKTLKDTLSPDEDAVLTALNGKSTLSADEAATLTGLASNRVSAALMMLELKKVCSKRADGRYEILMGM